MFCCSLSINFAKLMLFFDILEKKRQNESFGNVKIVSNKSIDLKKSKNEWWKPFIFTFQSCKFVTDYRTFKEDFLKVVDFVHYLRAEGYDMVTFERVCDVDKPDMLNC